MLYPTATKEKSKPIVTLSLIHTISIASRQTSPLKSLPKVHSKETKSDLFLKKKKNRTWIKTAADHRDSELCLFPTKDLGRKNHNSQRTNEQLRGTHSR